MGMATMTASLTPRKPLFEWGGTIRPSFRRVWCNGRACRGTAGEVQETDGAFGEWFVTRRTSDGPLGALECRGALSEAPWQLDGALGGDQVRQRHGLVAVLTARKDVRLDVGRVLPAQVELCADGPQLVGIQVLAVERRPARHPAVCKVGRHDLARDQRDGLDVGADVEVPLQQLQAAVLQAAQDEPREVAGLEQLLLLPLHPERERPIGEHPARQHDLVGQVEERAVQDGHQPLGVVVQERKDGLDVDVGGLRPGRAGPEPQLLVGRVEPRQRDGQQLVGGLRARGFL